LLHHSPISGTSVTVVPSHSTYVMVKGFGYRPVMTCHWVSRPASEPPKKEPAVPSQIERMAAIGAQPTTGAAAKNGMQFDDAKGRGVALIDERIHAMIRPRNGICQRSSASSI
jgi:hypothetical protein